MINSFCYDGCDMDVCLQFCNNNQNMCLVLRENLIYRYRYIGRKQQLLNVIEIFWERKYFKSTNILLVYIFTRYMRT